MMNTVFSDSGAYLRDGVKSLNKLGVCPEKEWRYSAKTNHGAKFTKKPPQKCYDSALDHQILSYHRIMPAMHDIRACLADGFPFGYNCF